MNLPIEPALVCSSDTAEMPDQSTAVARLRDLLDTAFDACVEEPEPPRCAAFGTAVRTALAAALADPALVSLEQRTGSPDTYRRHLIAADPCGRYTVAALVWLPGQASAVHAHHTWCGVAVLDGELTESLFAWDEAAGRALSRGQRVHAAGAVTYASAGRQAIHRLANVGTRPAVSLHVYGVPAGHLATHVNDVLAHV